MRFTLVCTSDGVELKIYSADNEPVAVYVSDDIEDVCNLVDKELRHEVRNFIRELQSMTATEVWADSWWDQVD